MMMEVAAMKKTMHWGAENVPSTYLHCLAQSIFDEKMEMVDLDNCYHHELGGHL